MSERQTPRPNRHEDSLFDYGDRLAAGQTPSPRDELEATAVRVHRALTAPQLFGQGVQADQKAAIWEEIMRSATIRPSQAPPALWNGAERQSAPRPAVGSRGMAGRPKPRPMWARAANVALALLIIIAGVGVVRGYGGLDGLTGPDRPATAPGFAAQPATPEPAATKAAAPVGTPAPLTACDLSGDIPIITDLAEDRPPVATTSLYVVRYDRTGVDPRGDLKLGCAGEESVLLAQNVVDVGPGPWPGTVGIRLLPPNVDDRSKAPLGYVNVATGATVTFGIPDRELTVWQAIEGKSPWVIGPSAANPATLAVVDLRTMDARPLSEVGGADVPANAGAGLSQPAADGAVAISVPLTTGTEAPPGDVLLLDASFDNTRWITVPESLPRNLAIALSPDGSHAAVVSAEVEGIAGSIRYGLIDVSNRGLVATSADIPYAGDQSPIWIQKGRSVAYLDGSKLQTLSLDGNGQPETVFEADSRLYGLQTTWDPNVIVASTRMAHGSDASADQGVRDVVYSVNVETGVVREFEGFDASALTGWISDAGALVMFQWDDAHPETVTYRVFDPVTGAQIGTIADAPTVQVAPRTLPTADPRSIAVSEDGRVEVVALGTQQIYAFTTGANGLTMRRVPSTDGMLSEAFLTANVVLSPDGTKLSLNGEEDEGRVRYLISLDDPNATWLAVPNTIPSDWGRGLITFADGA